MVVSCPFLSGTITPKLKSKTMRIRMGGCDQQTSGDWRQMEAYSALKSMYNRLIFVFFVFVRAHFGVVGLEIVKREARARERFESFVNW